MNWRQLLSAVVLLSPVIFDSCFSRSLNRLGSLRQRLANIPMNSLKDDDDASQEDLQQYPRNEDFKDPIEKSDLSQLIQQVEETLAAQRLRKQMQMQQQQQQQDEEYEQERLDAENSEDDQSMLPPGLQLQQQKRGRWQGFCFRRTRSGRRLPYICWRESDN